MPLTDSNLLKVNPIMRPNGNKTISWYTSFLREHLKLGEPGFGIKSPSWPPMTKSRSLTTAQTLFSKVAFMIHIVSVAEKTMFIDERFQRFNHPKRIFSCRKHKDNEKPTDLCGPPTGNGYFSSPFLLYCFPILYCNTPVINSRSVAIFLAATHHMESASPYLSCRGIPENSQVNSYSMN